MRQAILLLSRSSGNGRAGQWNRNPPYWQPENRITGWSSFFGGEDGYADCSDSPLARKKKATEGTEHTEELEGVNPLQRQKMHRTALIFP
jgi:hypothetical protein